MKARLLRIAVGAALLFAVVAIAVVALNRRDEAPVDEGEAFSATPQQIERGAYLARLGNCAACHTARGGAPFAGGSGIDTPFGTVYASNLTPDAATGLGRWSASHFWRALHNGRSRDGRLLYPAFPYPNYTLVTREDSDAIYAYLRTLAPVSQPNRPHTLRFPVDSQWALAVWRALFFTPGVHEPQAQRSAEWNRGSYLVRGLGHCSACHGGRNLLGATDDAIGLGGGLIPMQNWYAPSLASPHEASVADWDTAQITALLKNGVFARASVLGPMAEVVYRSTQHASDADLHAMAVYLKQLPPADAQARPDPPRADPAVRARGERVYADHCAQCHGDHGEGAPGVYPALAGNRAVTMANPANLVRVIVSGGYLPSTAGNPRPYGMPPFSHVLDDRDIAAVLSTMRQSWGNAAPPVEPLEVMRYR